MVTLVSILAFSNLPSCANVLENLIMLVTKGKIIRKPTVAMLESIFQFTFVDLNKVNQLGCSRSVT